MKKILLHRKSLLNALLAFLFISSFLLSGSAQAKANSAANVIGYRYQNEAVVTTELQQQLDAASNEDMISVIVTLKAQTNLSKISESNRNKQLSKVILALQRQANATQQSIITLLDNYQSEGSVSQYQSFWVFNGLAVSATSEVITELAGLSKVGSITPDDTFFAPQSHDAFGPAEPNLDLVNAPELWHLGFRGGGIVVANMDTGVSNYHPELASRWRGGTNSWFDPHNQHPDQPIDLNGHGTQTMGVMVAGDASGNSLGIAPQAQWIAVKIFNDQDNATTSAIHSGYQWLLDPDGDPFTADAPHVVNNSWTNQSPGCDLEFELDMQSLRAAGILPVFAAGNSGPGTNTSHSPSNNPSAFAVGGTNNSDNMYSSSSRGPSSCGEGENVFPEVVAPGINVKTTDLFGLYISPTGTSLSAPHVSGALALLLDAFPDLTSSQQAAALINSAVDLGIAGPDNDFGYGRLDVLSAYQWLEAGGEPTPTPDPTINLALNQPVTVSSSQDSGHDGSMAVDGDMSTFWKTARAKGKNKLPSEGITIDIGTSVSVGKVVLEWNDNFATDYRIQVSENNIIWTTVFTETNGNGSSDTVNFSPITARYVRMASTGWDSGSLRNWLNEIQIFSGSGSEPTPTPSPTPTSTPTQTTTPTPTATPTATPTPPPGGSTMHSGDLDGSSSTSRRNRWNAMATILVHDGDDSPLSGVTVNGSWSSGASGSGSCVTSASGLCTISKNNLKSGVSSVTFTLDNLTLSSFQYQSGDNHDPDGNGTEIVISR